MGVAWRKIWRDLWHNKLRTVLVELSIAVGVFAIGAIVLSTLATLWPALRATRVSVREALVYG